MKVLYDHQMFSMQKYGGITRYFVELIKHLPEKEEFELSIISSDNYYLNEDNDIFRLNNFMPDGQFKGKYFLRKRIYDFNQLYSKRTISRNKFDIFHPTFYDDYFFENLKAPYVITVHDLIAFKFDLGAQAYRHSHLKDQMTRVIRNANRIIAISENTKKDIIERFDICAERINVIYHGFDSTPKLQSSHLKKDYVLFVGARYNYKNFSNCAEAISLLFETEKNLEFVCVGDPFDEKEQELLRRLGIIDRAKSLRVNDATLNTLYAEARLFIFPSFYEGFGMPILEAFVNNCPVCLSETSCFPEIAGEAAEYFDPDDPQSMVFAMKEILQSDDRAKELIRLGEERLEQFSWEKTATETLETYRQVLN